MKKFILFFLFTIIMLFTSCKTHYKTNFESNGLGIFHYIDTIKTSKKFNISYPNEKY